MAMTHNKITFKSFSKYVTPSILLLIFISIYTSIDSLFIARYIGTEALAGQGITMPIYSIAFACGIMFATGGGAIIAIHLGRKDQHSANKTFSSLIVAGSIFGIISTTLALFNIELLLQLLGANEQLMGNAKAYGFYLILSILPLIYKVIFDSALRIINKPQFVLMISIVGGVLNIVFDYLFIVELEMGIAGAGLATFIGIIITVLLGYCGLFLEREKLRFSLCLPDLKVLKDSVINGSSEMVNEVAISTTTLVLNYLTLKYIGTQGVAAVAIILTLEFFAISMFVGFAMGVAPLISFNHGSENSDNLRSIMTYSRIFLLFGSIATVTLCFIFHEDLIGLFVAPNSEVFAITKNAMFYIIPSFLVSGINIFASSLFTSFENGKISALISFTKTFVFLLIAALILPGQFGIVGVWLIVPVAEFLCLILSLYYMIKYQKKYNYRLF